MKYKIFYAYGDCRYLNRVDDNNGKGYTEEELDAACEALGNDATVTIVKMN